MVIERVVDEAVDEFLGRSKKSWALMLVMFILGAALVAALMIKVAKRRPLVTFNEEVTDVTATAPTSGVSGLRYANPFSSPSWTSGRARVARSEAAMRERVTRTASRLTPRRNTRMAEHDQRVAGPGKLNASN